MFVRFVVAEIRKEEEELASRLYMATCLKAITNNVANSLGGVTISKELSDIINSEERIETRTAEEIELRIKNKLKEMGQ